MNFDISFKRQMQLYSQMLVNTGLGLIVTVQTHHLNMLDSLNKIIWKMWLICQKIMLISMEKNPQKTTKTKQGRKKTPTN